MTTFERLHGFVDVLCVDWRSLTWEQVQEQHTEDLFKRELVFNDFFTRVFDKPPRSGLFLQMVQLRCKRESAESEVELGEYGGHQTELIKSLRARNRDLEAQLAMHHDKNSIPWEQGQAPSSTEELETVDLASGAVVADDEVNPELARNRKKHQCCILAIVVGVLVAIVAPILVSSVNF